MVDVRDGRQAEVEARGARWAGRSLEQLPPDGVLITVLPGSPELRAVMLGSPDGRSAAGMDRLSRGAAWIDLTSAAPDLARDMADAAASHGVHYVEAPMGGGPADAERGTLTLYVAGDTADIARFRPLLQAFGEPTRIRHMGSHGAGYLTKLLINQLWFGQALAVGEAVLLGSHAGLTLDRLAEVLDDSPAGSAFTRTYLPALGQGDYIRAFGLGRIVEELDSLARMADETGSPWTLSSRATDMYRDALAHFGDVAGELMGVAWLEHIAGRTLRDGSPGRP